MVSQCVLKSAINNKKNQMHKSFFFFLPELKAYRWGFKKWERKKQVFQGQLLNFLIMSFLTWNGTVSVPFQFHLKGANWKDVLTAFCLCPAWQCRNLSKWRTRNLQEVFFSFLFVRIADQFRSHLNRFSILIWWIKTTHSGKWTSGWD